MPRLSALHADPAAVLRDAEVDMTHFAGQGTGRTLAWAGSAAWIDRALAHPATAALVVPPDLAERVPASLGQIAEPSPEIAFCRLHNRLAAPGMRAPATPGIHPSASIHPRAWVEEGAEIGPDVTVEANAVVHAGTVLGEGALVGSGAVIGGDGKMVRQVGDERIRVLHVGGVRIGAQAEIHSGVVIQRATFAEFTEIGPRCVLVSGVRIAHGVRMGADCQLALGAQVSGHSTLGDRVWLGPGAVVSSVIEVGDDARVEIGAVAVRSIPAGARYAGLFARPHARMRAISESIARLAEG